MYIWLLEVAKSYFVLFYLEKSVWSDLYSSISPVYCSYIWPTMYGRYHVKLYPLSEYGVSMQLILHLVGQLLLLFVQVWWSWWHCLWAVILLWEWIQLICAWATEMYKPTDAVLSEVLNSRIFPGGYPLTFLQGWAFLHFEHNVYILSMMVWHKVSIFEHDV